MSAPKHTPGPWEAIENGHIYDQRLQILAVARHSRHSKANARLMAAAPALLKVLRMARAKIAAELQVLVMGHTGPDGLIDDAEVVLLIEAEQDLINQIDAAIAKAEGAA